MTDFEKHWHDRYMSNMVSVETLQMLIAAGKLTQGTVDGWIEERRERYGE
jgi:hypothetical protein